MSHPAPTLETPRFQLRLFQESDVDALAALYADPEVMRYMKGPRPRELAEKQVHTLAEQFDKTGYTQFAVESKATGEVVGRVGLWPLDQTDEVELGYIVARSLWGQGVATETAAVCVEDGFRRLGLSFLAAICDLEHKASARVMQKLGFRYVRQARFYDTDVLYYRLDRGPQYDG
jgi:ribosomal-protein-alanine N-acetyltransferase